MADEDGHAKPDGPPPHADPDARPPHADPGAPPAGGAGPLDRAQPSGVLVVGMGNDLRGDDGAGLAVIQEVAGLAIPGVRAMWSHQLVPELAEPIAAATRVVFVDAALPVDLAPGDSGIAKDSGIAEDTGIAKDAEDAGVEVRRITSAEPALAGHQASPEALLGLVALVGLDVPEAFVVTVPAHDLGLTEQLSPDTRAAVKVAVGAVRRLCSPNPADGA